MQETRDQISLFSLDPHRWPDALARLPHGALWQSFLPGADPAGAISVLGPRIVESLSGCLAIIPVPDLSSALAQAGIPFWPPPDFSTIARALAEDALACTTDDGKILVQCPLRHRSRTEWEAAINACIAHATLALSGEAVCDSLDALVVCPSADIRAMIPFADADARLRIEEAFCLCDGDLRKIPSHYLHRSAVCGMLENIRSILNSPSSGITGKDSSGWPVWWEPPYGGARVNSALIVSSLGTGDAS